MEFPYLLIENTAHQSAIWAGNNDSLTTDFSLAEPFQYLGWTIVDGDDKGQGSSRARLRKALKTFQDNDFHLGTVLIDGQFSHPEIFPDGYRKIIKEIHNDFSVSYVGLNTDFVSSSSSVKFFESCEDIKDKGFSFIKTNINFGDCFNEAILRSSDNISNEDFITSIYDDIFIESENPPIYISFQSYQKDAVVVSLMHTFNDNPIFISDIPTKQNFDIFKKHTKSDNFS